MTQIRAFVSYARADTDTVKALVGRLEAHDVAIWLDARSIPVSSDWLQEILRGIESCDVFVFVFSMRSAVSEVCKLELSHAATHCKRIVPVLIEPVGGMELPQELASRQWLDVTRAGLGDGVLRQLVQAISTDLPWIRQHTRLVEGAGQWERTRRDPSALLSGLLLDEAEEWQRMVPHAPEPRPTALQLEFIRESRRRQSIDDAVTDVMHGLSLLDDDQPRRAREYIDRAGVALEAVDEDSLVARIASWSVTRRASRPIVHCTSGLSSIVLAERVLDGSAILGVDRDGRLALWDAVLGERIGEWRLPLAPSRGAVSPDGGLLAVSSAGSLVLWNLREAGLVAQFDAHTQGVTALAFSADGRRLMSGSLDATAAVWSVADAQLVRRLEGHLTPVWAVALSNDGGVALTGACGVHCRPEERAFNLARTGHDETVRCWDVDTGAPVARFPCTSWVLAVRLLADDRTALVATVNHWGNPQGVDVMDIRTGGEPVAHVPYTASPVWDLSATPSGNRILFGLQDRTAVIWGVAEQSILSFLDHDTKVSTVSLSEDGATAITGTVSGEVQLWNVLEERCVRTIPTDGRSVGGLDVVPDLGVVTGAGIRVADLSADWWQAEVADGTANYPISVWDVDTGVRLLTRRVGLQPVLELAVVPGSTRAVCCNVGRDVVLVDLLGGDDEPPVRLPAPGTVVDLDISSDGSTAIMANAHPEGGAVHVLDLAELRWRDVFTGHGGPVRAVAALPDGRAASLSKDGALLVWDLADRAELARIRHPHPGISGMSISADGSALAVGGNDGLVRRWRLDRPADRPTVMLGHTVRVKDVALSADGSVAVSVGDDGTLRAFHVPSGGRLAALAEHALGAQYVRFVRDEQVIVSAGEDGLLVIHDIGFATRLPVEEAAYRAAVERLAVEPTNIDARLEVACWFAFRGEWGRALRAFDTALAFVPAPERARLGKASAVEAAVCALMAGVPLIAFSWFEHTRDVNGRAALLRDHVVHKAADLMAQLVSTASNRDELGAFVATFSALAGERASDGRCALHAAAEAGNERAVAALLEHGADVDARTAGPPWTTALHLAAKRGREPVVKLLLQAGADQNARDGQGWTPLHKAIESPLPVVLALLAHGADPDAASNAGHRPLHYAAFLSRLDVIDVLLPTGVDVHATDEHGLTALHFAAQRADGDVVQALLTAGVPPSARSHDGVLAEDIARQKENNAALRILSEHSHGAF